MVGLAADAVRPDRSARENARLSVPHLRPTNAMAIREAAAVERPDEHLTASDARRGPPRAWSHEHPSYFVVSISVWGNPKFR